MNDVVKIIEDSDSSSSSLLELLQFASKLHRTFKSPSLVDSMVKTIPKAFSSIPLLVENRDHQHTSFLFTMIGDLAAKSVKVRDDLLSRGVLEYIFNPFQFTQIPIIEGSLLELHRKACFALHYLSGGKPSINYETISPRLETLSFWLSRSTDSEVLIHLLNVFASICDGRDLYIQGVINSGAVPRIVELLNDPNPDIQIPALKCVGNIVIGSDAQTAFIINLGVVPSLLWLLDSPNCRKAAAWTLSNIAAGTSDHIQLLSDCAVLPKVLELCRSRNNNQEEKHVQNEALWTISNVCNGGTPEQVWYFFQIGFIPVMVSFLDLKTTNVKMIAVALEGIENILRVGKQINKLQVVIDEMKCSNALELLNDLRKHSNRTIFSRVERMFADYLQKE